MDIITPSIIAWYKKSLEMISPAMFESAGFPLCSEDGIRPPTLRKFDKVLATYQYIDRNIPDSYKKNDDGVLMGLNDEDCLTCHDMPDIALKMMGLFSHKYKEKTGRLLSDDWGFQGRGNYEYGPPPYAHFIRFICILKGQEDALEKGDFVRINETINEVMAGQPDAKTAFLNLISIPPDWEMPNDHPLTIEGDHPGTLLGELYRRERDAHQEYGASLPESLEKSFRRDEYLLHDEALHKRLMQTVDSVLETNAEGIDTIIQGFDEIDPEKLQNPHFVNAALMMARLRQQANMETSIPMPTHLWDRFLSRQ